MVCVVVGLFKTDLPPKIIPRPGLAMRRPKCSLACKLECGNGSAAGGQSLQATRHNPHAARSLQASTRETEGTGLEPVRACAQRFSRPPPYQLGLALPVTAAQLSGPAGAAVPSMFAFCLPLAGANRLATALARSASSMML